MTYHSKKIGIITIHDVSAFQDHLSNTIETMKRIEESHVKYNIADYSQLPQEISGYQRYLFNFYR